MITVRQKGDFANLTRYFERVKKIRKTDILHKYGKLGVAALSSATPTESGKTASSWSYEIIQNRSGAQIVFSNSNINKGVNIAIILQYGHGTGTGGWVEGRDYINPAIQGVFEQFASDIWKEVTRL
ncbi:HK97 gp10 family phage protein [Enterococcus cecorum]|nr:HK97 gp10 family phage protein [Enterococcus cecorum]